MAVHNTSTNYMESTEDIKPSSFPRSRSNDITSFHSTPPHADTGTSNLETGSWPGRGLYICSRVCICVCIQAWFKSRVSIHGSSGGGGGDINNYS